MLDFGRSWGAERQSSKMISFPRSSSTQTLSELMIPPSCLQEFGIQAPEWHHHTAWGEFVFLISILLEGRCSSFRRPGRPCAHALSCWNGHSSFHCRGYFWILGDYDSLFSHVIFQHPRGKSCHIACENQGELRVTSKEKSPQQEATRGKQGS